jgi:hypothetical protein
MKSEALPMAITIDTKLKEIVKSPEAVAILDKYSPGFLDNKQLKMVYGMTFREITELPHSSLSQDVIEAIEKEFAELG